MKKLLVFFVAMGIAVAGFAEANRTKLFAADFILPLSYQFPDNDQISATMASVGFGVKFMEFFDEKIGYYASGEVFFPVGYSLYDSSNTKYEVKIKDYKSFWALGAFIGPAFKVMDNSSLKMIVSPGVHFTGLFTSIDGYNTTKYSFGIGANYSCAYYFKSNIFVIGGADLMFDFYCWTNSSYDKKKSEGIANFTFTPKVGIGFQY